MNSISRPAAQALSAVFGAAMVVLASFGANGAGLVAAEVKLASAASARQDEKKLKADIDQALADAETAMQEKKFAAALQRLEAARRVAPLNKGVLDLLAKAQAALDADTAEKKKLTAFRTHMDAGKAAMRAERFPDAVKEFKNLFRPSEEVEETGERDGDGDGETREQPRPSAGAEASGTEPTQQMTQPSDEEGGGS